MTAAAAAGAAAAIRQRKQQEEEHMTPYTPDDLAQGWEFKILRSATGMFKYPHVLQQVIQEEGRAGWVLLEKFDNQRLRFKRPGSARAGDAALRDSGGAAGGGYDAYRTTYGISEGQLAFRIIGSILCIAAVVIVLIVFFVNRS